MIRLLIEDVHAATWAATRAVFLLVGTDRYRRFLESLRAEPRAQPVVEALEHARLGLPEVRGAPRATALAGEVEETLDAPRIGRCGACGVLVQRTLIDDRQVRIEPATLAVEHLVDFFQSFFAYARAQLGSVAFCKLVLVLDHDERTGELLALLGDDLLPLDGPFADAAPDGCFSAVGDFK